MLIAPTLQRVRVPLSRRPAPSRTHAYSGLLPAVCEDSLPSSGSELRDARQTEAHQEDSLTQECRMETEEDVLGVARFLEGGLYEHNPSTR